MLNVHVEIDPTVVEHVNRMLAKTPDKAKIVFRNAINRGLTAGRTQAEKEIKARYAITTGNLNHYKTVRLKQAGQSGSDVAGEIEFAGTKIPVYKFSPRPKTRGYTSKFVNGRCGWRINRSVGATDIRESGHKSFPGGFIATFKSGHTGIFKRTGGKTKNGKPKIREYWGPSAADMLDYEPAREAVLDRAAEITNKRMDQELYRILNGF